jgi:serine carboxypeptidase-like clade 1
MLYSYLFRFDLVILLLNQIVDVSLQLLGEVSQSHILYRNCDHVSLRANDRTTERRTTLQQETGVLKHPPPCPALDCQVSPL